MPTREEIRECKIVLALSAVLGLAATGGLILQNAEAARYDRLKTETESMIEEQYSNYVSRHKSCADSSQVDAVTVIHNEDSDTALDSVIQIEDKIETLESKKAQSVIYKSSEYFVESAEPDDSIEYVSPTTINMEIPYGDCSNYMYMDYRALTNPDTPQWEMQQNAYTDWQGIRVYDGCYMVAMGTFYGEVGDKFIITTDRGNVYNVIMGDAKGWDSVDGWYHIAGDGRNNVVEFIVDTDYLDSYALTMGDLGVLDNIGGDIIKIERINE